MEMYRDQFGEFVCGYKGFNPQSPDIHIQILKTDL